MFPVTNIKVAGFEPKWAAFRGFSILFDNPIGCYCPRDGVQLLKNDFDPSGQTDFYRVLRDGLQDLEPATLMANHGFCPLPSDSYHVTAWDGLNDGNLERMPPEQQEGLRSFLSQLPEAMLRPNPFTDIPNQSPLPAAPSPISFEFSELAAWGDVVLVAKLKPTESAQSALDEIVVARKALSEQFFPPFGIEPGLRYSPHVSLGYFANVEGCQSTNACIPEWNQTFLECLRGLTLTFESASLYGFTDMATFFRA